MKKVKSYLPGLALCLAIAVPAWFLGKLFPLIGGPLFAILAGMAAAVVWKDKGKFSKGITFTSKKVLQYAVILLGFGMNLSVVLDVYKRQNFYGEINEDTLNDMLAAGYLAGIGDKSATYSTPKQYNEWKGIQLSLIHI